MYKSLKSYITGSVALITGILIFSGSLQAQGNRQQKQQSKNDFKTVVDVVESTSNISEFAQMLGYAGYVLNQQNKEFTVLAPNNGAIEDMDPKKRKYPDGIVKKHVLQGEMSKDMIEKQMSVQVEKTIDSADNGTIYVVDGLVRSPQKQQQKK